MTIIQSNLKPTNIIINSDGHVCLTDFGLAQELLKSSSQRDMALECLGRCDNLFLYKNNMLIMFCFLAPEVLQTNCFGREADFWSFGIVLFELLTGLV